MRLQSSRESVRARLSALGSVVVGLFMSSAFASWCVLLGGLAGITGCSAAAPHESGSGGGDDSALLATTSDASISAEVESVLTSLTATHYQHDSDIDAARGLYDTDCSGFVSFVLQTARSDAYDELQAATNTDRALAGSYVTFIQGLSAGAQPQWTRIHHAKYLQAGDIIAWLIPAGVPSDDTGHVMLVEHDATVSGNEATVSIVDSTDTGHGDADPRSPSDPSGVGRGTIVLTLDADGEPTGYRWSTDADSPAYPTTVMMARVD
jgi:hypothetical protein